MDVNKLLDTMPAKNQLRSGWREYYGTTIERAHADTWSLPEREARLVGVLVQLHEAETTIAAYVQSVAQKEAVLEELRGQLKGFQMRAGKAAKRSAVDEESE